MKDIYFAIAAAALVGLILSTYGVRVLRHGIARHDRTTKVGGSVLLSDAFVDGFQWVAGPLARGCVRLGFTANGLTWLSLLTGVGAGVGLAFGHFGLATLLTLVSTVSDILDGQVARITDGGSDAGEVLDAAVDRYTEFAFLAGLVIYWRQDPLPLVVTLAAVLACFMVSYSTAKAEALGVPPPRGPMRRHERGTYMIVGAAFTSYVGDAIAAHEPGLPRAFPMFLAVLVIAVAANYSAIMRLIKIGNAVRARGKR